MVAFPHNIRYNMNRIGVGTIIYKTKGEQF